ncbi:MAG: CHAP domain-containing protein [Acetobacteraceae bacterium]|nr:CHAP domain-containing protein [Acetobacteraceae bacterium]
MRFASLPAATDDAEDYGGSLQCVPFARAASGIELKGNAAEWWYAAAGVYDRGERPELGSVLNFRSTGRMRLGHVAVVSGIFNDREIEVDHANWAGAGAYSGGVQRGVHVIDVSAENDWSAVRVALGTGDYGSTYPTYGFIYDRPDTGTMMATRDRASDADDADATEVAEAPATAAHLIRAATHRAATSRVSFPTSHVTLRPIVKHISFGRRSQG